MSLASRSHTELLPHLFRQEYAKMTAVLCRHFSLQHIEIAEDIASETFLKASEHWAVNGVPENPTAWLYTVARNKMKDHLRRIAVFEKQVRPVIQPEETEAGPDFEFSSRHTSDSQLAMIFAVCNSSNSAEGQICLALQVLCGFSVEEIANAFLSKTETIKKRLYRARINLRNDNFKIGILSEVEISSRLEPVLRTLYLLFNEGYFSKTNDRLIRKELCSEAVRLTLVLTENPLTNTPEVNALLALMCFQSSRLEARTDERGATVLFEEQDRVLWDESLIEKGNYYLVSACSGAEVSRYHLEAAIAYWHTTPATDQKWQHILLLYNRLILVEYSPASALNRVFAYAQVYGHKNAIDEAERLNLTGSNFYHGLLGYLYTDIDNDKAAGHYRQAIALAGSEAEKRVLLKAIEKLVQGGNRR